MLDYGHRTFLFQIFEVALTVKTTKLDEKPKVNFAYSWNCYPSWGLIQEYLIIWSRRNQERMRKWMFYKLREYGVSEPNQHLHWQSLVTPISLSYAGPSSCFGCQSLLPSGCLCTVLDIWKMQSHPPRKTDPRTLRERADVFLLNCNWTELKIGTELKLKCTKNQPSAPAQSGAASGRQKNTAISDTSGVSSRNHLLQGWAKMLYGMRGRLNILYLSLTWINGFSDNTIYGCSRTLNWSFLIEPSTMQFPKFIFSPLWYSRTFTCPLVFLICFQKPSTLDYHRTPRGQGPANGVPEDLSSWPILGRFLEPLFSSKCIFLGPILQKLC